MAVLTYLECGCAIRTDGTRVWCPSCMDPAPKGAKMTGNEWKEAFAREAVAEDRVDMDHFRIVLGEMARTLNLQAQLVALWIGVDLYDAENTPEATFAEIGSVLHELRKQHQYMNGGQG